MCELTIGRFPQPTIFALRGDLFRKLLISRQIAVLPFG
jgi:hypothetical protein